MARITIEDCLNHTPNRFALVCVAAQRAHDLIKGADPLIVCENKEGVTSLREVAAGKVGSITTVPHVRTSVRSNKS